MNDYIQCKFNDYLNGDCDGWELWEVVHYYGYSGFTVNKDSTLTLWD